MNTKILLHVCDSYDCDYVQHTTFCFYLIDFQLNTNFPSKFCVFTVKSPSVTQRSVSRDNAFEKSKIQSPFFFLKTIAWNNSFTLIENNSGFEDSEVWTQCNMLTVHYSLVTGHVFSNLFTMQ